MTSELTSVVLSVNGEKHELSVSPVWSLAYVLRDKLGLTGTKVMCNEGECGSCTVIVDGKPMLSCLMLAIECEGKNILTIEGMVDSRTGDLHPLQQAFMELSAMQCGVCTPGMILTAKALLDKNSSPSEDEVREALAGNICRCGTYKRITQSVLLAAERMKKEA